MSSLLPICFQKYSGLKSTNSVVSGKGKSRQVPDFEQSGCHSERKNWSARTKMRSNADVVSPWCNLTFPDSELRRFLSPKLLELYYRVRQRREIEAAELDHLEECPSCEYKCVIENEMEKLFRCENKGCGAVTCKGCKKSVTHSCATVRSAIDRSSRNQGYSPTATGGASTHTLSVLQCNKVVRGYDHFSDVSKAAKRALEELKKSHPDVDINDINIDMAAGHERVAYVRVNGRKKHHRDFDGGKGSWMNGGRKPSGTGGCCSLQDKFGGLEMIRQISTAWPRDLVVTAEFVGMLRSDGSRIKNSKMILREEEGRSSLERSRIGSLPERVALPKHVKHLALRGCASRSRQCIRVELTLRFQPASCRISPFPTQLAVSWPAEIDQCSRSGSLAPNEELSIADTHDSRSSRKRTKKNYDVTTIMGRRIRQESCHGWGHQKERALRQPLDLRHRNTVAMADIGKGYITERFEARSISVMHDQCKHSSMVHCLLQSRHRRRYTIRIIRGYTTPLPTWIPVGGWVLDFFWSIHDFVKGLTYGLQAFKAPRIVDDDQFTGALEVWLKTYPELPPQGHNNSPFELFTRWRTRIQVLGSRASSELSPFEGLRVQDPGHDSSGLRHTLREKRRERTTFSSEDGWRAKHEQFQQLTPQNDRDFADLNSKVVRAALSN
ncbi:hypothetical protein BU15DRAFT_67958 [Melanogaster broomeanus]|nr:hypothetical protein BU15DRAFT_67958 [Melanogaster broomeanus]